MEIKDIIRLYNAKKGVGSKSTLYMYYNDDFPSELFRAKHPNMTDEEFKYVKDTYLNETKTILQKPISDIQRVMNSRNYSIEYSDPDIAEHFSYIDNWFKNIYIPNVIIDPKSILTIYLDPNRVEIDEDGNVKTNERPYFQPYLVRSFNLIHRSKDATIYKIKGEADYNFVIIRDNIYSQYNINRRDSEYRPTLSVPLINPMVSRRADGFKKLNDEDELEIVSYLDAAIPKLNSIAYNLILRRCAEVKHIIPQKWYIKQQCKTCNGEGIIGYDEDKKCDITCKKCGGAKYTAVTPFTDIEVKIPETGLDPQLIAPTPPMGYITAPLEFISILSKRISDDSEEAFEFMGKNYSNSNVKGTDTALGKMIDREMFFGFLETITPDILSTLQWTITTLSSLIFPDKDNAVIIRKNSAYDVVGIAELEFEFTDALTKGSPASILREKLKNLYDINGKTEEFEIIDKYYLYENNDTINGDVSMNMRSRLSAVISKNVMRWVSQRIPESEFIALAQKEIQSMASPYEIIPSVPTEPVDGGSI